MTDEKKTETVHAPLLPFSKKGFAVAAQLFGLLVAIPAAGFLMMLSLYIALGVFLFGVNAVIVGVTIEHGLLARQAPVAERAADGVDG